MDLNCDECKIDHMLTSAQHVLKNPQYFLSSQEVKEIRWKFCTCIICQHSSTSNLSRQIA